MRLNLYLTSLLLTGCTPQFEMATWNIYWDNPSDPGNAWSLRRDTVIAQINARRPAVVGLQEAQAAHLWDLARRLPDYTPVSIPIEPGDPTDYDALIMYRHGQLSLTGWDLFWLGPDPDSPGSMFEALPGESGFNQPRAATCLDFDVPLRVCATHLGGPSSVLERSAQVLLERGSFGPVVIMGDFNTLPYSQATWPIASGVPINDVYDQFANAGFKDAIKVTTPNNRVASGCGFEQTGCPIELSFDGRIDWIMLKEVCLMGAQQVFTFRPDGRPASDHWMQVATVSPYVSPLAPECR